MELPFFAVARDLRGFGQDGIFGTERTALRVRVTELRDGCAWIVTADLRSAGVPLVINAEQLEALEPAGHVIAHPDALVF